MFQPGVPSVPLRGLGVNETANKVGVVVLVGITAVAAWWLLGDYGKVKKSRNAQRQHEEDLKAVARSKAEQEKYVSPTPPPGGYYIVGYKDPPGPRARIGMGDVAATMAQAKKSAHDMESSGFYARIRKTKPKGW